MSSLVFQTQQPGAQTHALVIGVGAYPHLDGGGSSIHFAEASMGQLSSPPLSARAIADWLITEFRNDDSPLGSVRLLLSEDDDPPYLNPSSGDTHSVPVPAIDEVRTAVDEWKADGDGDEDNLMLFFFAGHGIARGEVLSLLLTDFGASANRPFEGAIDFVGFHNGMKKCKARRQCFFVDACRIGSPRLLTDTGDYAGDPLLHAGLQDFSPSRRAPVFYSAFAGREAFGFRGRTSFFTDALLRSMKGAASDDAGGDWWVDTAQLHRALEFYLQYAVAVGHQVEQSNLTNHLSTFPLHRIETPTAPVMIGCEPESYNQQADLWYEVESNRTARDHREATDWLVELPVQPVEYVFGADLDDQTVTPQPERRTVRPPYRLAKVRI